MHSFTPMFTLLVALTCSLHVSLVHALVVVSSPALSDIWVAGQTYDVIWKAVGSNRPFAIVLSSLDGQTSVTLNPETDPTTQSYSASVPQDVAAGTYSVQFTDAQTDLPVAQSSPFKIVAGAVQGPTTSSAAPTSTSSAAAQPSVGISITSPTSNTKWAQGQSYDIIWTSTGSLDDFTITIFSASGNGFVLSDDTDPASQTASVPIGANIAAGKWALQFSDKAANTVLVRSPFFNVVAPSVSTTTAAAAASSSSALPSTSSSAAPVVVPTTTSSVSSAPNPSPSSTASPSSASSVASTKASASSPAPVPSSTPPTRSTTQASASHSSSSTATIVIAAHPTASPPPSSGSSETSSASSSSDSHVGAIAGGVIGAIVALAGLGWLALGYIRRRRSREFDGEYFADKGAEAGVIGGNAGTPGGSNNDHDNQWMYGTIPVASPGAGLGGSPYPPLSPAHSTHFNVQDTRYHTQPPYAPSPTTSFAPHYPAAAPMSQIDHAAASYVPAPVTYQQQPAIAHPYGPDRSAPYGYPADAPAPGQYAGYAPPAPLSAVAPMHVPPPAALATVAPLVPRAPAPAVPAPAPASAPYINTHPAGGVSRPSHEAEPSPYADDAYSDLPYR